MGPFLNNFWTHFQGAFFMIFCQKNIQNANADIAFSLVFEMKSAFFQKGRKQAASRNAHPKNDPKMVHFEVQKWSKKKSKKRHQKRPNLGPWGAAKTGAGGKRV